MKKRAWVLGSSLLGLALGLSAQAHAEDIVVEGAPAGGVTVEGAAPAGPAEGAKTAEPEQAKQRGFYAGGGVGGSFWEGEEGSEVFDSTFQIDDIDSENDFMWTVFGGYRIAEWGGLEVGYTDLGGFGVSGTDTVSVPPVDFDGDVDANGIEARVRVWHHLGVPWLQGIGGVGVFIFDSDQDMNRRALSPREDSGESLTVSAGLQFQVHRNVLIRTEWQRYFDVLDQSVDTVQASVVFGFYDLFGQGEAGGSMGGIIIE